MTIYDIFKKSIELGIENDFRPREMVTAYPWQEKIRNSQGEEFINHYADSGVVWIENISTPVKIVAMGLEIGLDEVLVLEHWGKQEQKKADLFISHHPRGRLLPTFHYIIKTQLGNLVSQGVKIEGLEKYFDKRVKEIQADIIASNFNRIRDTLKLLKLNYIAIHTPADNLAACYVQRSIQEAGAETVGDCLEILLKIPEYQIIKNEFGIQPIILSGKPGNKLGKFLLTEFTGGEEGPHRIYRAMKESGVDTLLVMHLSSKALREAKKLKLNIISCGHVSSDSLGFNLLCDIIEKEGIEIINIGGFLRYSRNKNF